MCVCDASHTNRRCTYGCAGASNTDTGGGPPRMGAVEEKLSAVEEASESTRERAEARFMFEVIISFISCLYCLYVW